MRTQTARAARLAAWAATALILDGVLVGQVAFAAFLVDQTLWVAFIGSALALLVLLANDGVPAALDPQSPVGQGLVSSVVTALFLFALVLAATRAIQHRLELSHNLVRRLDAPIEKLEGLRPDIARGQRSGDHRHADRRRAGRPLAHVA